MKSADKKFIRALKGEKLAVPPIWLMRQAGRYLPEYRATRKVAGSFLDLCYTPEHAVEVTLQPIRRYGFDASIMFSDILVVPDALGQKVWFEEGVGPRLEPISSVEELKALDPSRVLSHLAPVFETVKGLRENLPAETALIGFAGAPWTVATYMVGGRGSPDQGAAKAWAYADRQGFQSLIDLLTDVTGDYLEAQVKAGAEVLQIFDTWAGSLPSDFFRSFCLEPVQKLRARLKASCPDVPVIAFPRGVGAAYETYFLETAVDAVSIDTSIDPKWAARVLQPLGAVQGNLDPLLLVAGGAAMDKGVDDILAALSGGPFVFNLGHGIVPQTPPEHVERLVKRIRG
ncbi:MAG: uroporphyrinogen decarboxylase [Parvibaculum sp.]